MTSDAKIISCGDYIKLSKMSLRLPLHHSGRRNRSKSEPAVTLEPPCHVPAHFWCNSSHAWLIAIPSELW